MNSILQTFTSPGWDHLVQALLHSLWIGIVWAILLAAGLRVTGAEANRRYLLSLGALAGLVLTTLFAWAAPTVDWNAQPSASSSAVLLQKGESVPILRNANEGPSVGLALGARREGPPVTPAASHWTGLAAVTWLVGFAAMLMRLAAQLIEVRRSTRGAGRVEDSALLRHLVELKQALGIRRAVELVASAAIHVPCVVGVFTPVIMLPASMITGIPSEQMRAILAHELAHIRRHDFLINIFQKVVEALLFFNPALWWINRQIRLEREACCDALAVDVLPERSIYAQALIEVVDHYRHGHISLQPAFPGDRETSTLLERVKRLLAPGYQPLVRLPLTTFIFVMLLSGLFLAGMWRGSHFALAMAAEILTAEQRIEKIATLKAEHASSGDNGVYNYDGIFTAADRITISGRIRTEDGTQLKRWPHINVQVIRPHHHIGSGAEPRSDGTFETKVEYGRVYLGLVQAGYAPVFLDPLETVPGGSITNIEIVLKPGFPASIQVRDPQGNPVPGAELEGTFDHPAGFIPLKLTTNDKGEARISDAIDFPMTWKATAPGFQTDQRKDVRLQKDSPVLWTVQPAQLTKGAVVSRESGEPIPGAKIKLIHRGPKFQFTNPQVEHAQVLDTTDQRGSFSLETLVEGAEHVLAVEASGFATRLVHGVFAGQEIPTVKLGPEIFIEGVIQGDLSRLQGFPNPFVHVSDSIRIGDQTHGYGEMVPVTIQDDVGHFRAGNRREGEVRITAADQEVVLNVARSLTNVVIQLAPAVAKEGNRPDGSRTVIVQINVPPEAPSVRGVLNVRSWTDSIHVNEDQRITITNNQARIEAVAPGWFSYEATGLIGYWIPQQHAMRIDEGEDDVVLSVNALPAGAIHGSVHAEDGSDIGGVHITVVEARRAPNKDEPFLGEVGKRSAWSNDGPTRYMAQPLPLGGEYIIVARRENKMAVSEPITLTAESPIREMDLRFSPGKQIKGLVVDENGKPMSRVEVKLNFQMTMHGFGFPGVLTDESGRFTIDDANPNAPGVYYLTIDDEKGHQPIRSAAEFGEVNRLQLKRGLSLSGVVVHSETGTPLAGVELYAMVAEPKPGENFSYINADSKSDASGRVTFSQLADRDYQIGCRSGEIARIKVRAGQTNPIVIPISPNPGAQVTEAATR